MPATKKTKATPNPEEESQNEPIKAMEFAQTMLNKFCVFLQSVLKDGSEQYIEKIRQAGPNGLIAYVGASIYQDKDNLDLIVVRCIQDFKLTRKRFKDEDIEKFKRFLQCFIDIYTEIQTS